jgi:hypothetical protein
MVSKNTVIAFLLCTAVLLGVILIFQLHPSYAGSTTRAGDYVVASARLDTGTDLLWLINVHTQQLIAYGVDRNGLIANLGSIDLDVIFQPPPNIIMPPPAPRTGTTTPTTPGTGTTTPATPRKRTNTTVVP